MAFSKSFDQPGELVEKKRRAEKGTGLKGPPT